MAAAACSWAPTGLRGLTPVSQHKSLSSTQASFQGKPINLKTKNALFGKRSSSRASPLHITSALNPSLVISLSTGASLFLGRFVFLSFQRENVTKQGLPEQNGMTHFEAGDTRARNFQAFSRPMTQLDSTLLMFLLGDPLVILQHTSSWPLRAMDTVQTSFELWQKKEQFLGPGY